ncbi:MAG: hypothetical protein Q7S22_08270 [Candidatus Micrarchaeota archaeon]|nr:hypothetical protein [Candidatus Micrarchaeota archaeon]
MIIQVKKGLVEPNFKDGPKETRRIRRDALDSFLKHLLFEEPFKGVKVNRSTACFEFKGTSVVTEYTPDTVMGIMIARGNVLNPYTEPIIEIECASLVNSVGIDIAFSFAKKCQNVQTIGQNVRPGTSMVSVSSNDVPSQTDHENIVIVSALSVPTRITLRMNDRTVTCEIE